MDIFLVPGQLGPDTTPQFRLGLTISPEERPCSEEQSPLIYFKLFSLSFPLLERQGYHISLQIFTYMLWEHVTGVSSKSHPIAGEAPITGSTWSF